MALAPHEAHEEGAEQECRTIGEDEQGHVDHAPEHGCQRSGEDGIERKEAHGGTGYGGVAVLGDALVPLAIPRQQPLVEGLPRQVRVKVVEQEVGEENDAEDDEPGGQPAREGHSRLGPEPPHPRLGAEPHLGS